MSGPDAAVGREPSEGETEAPPVQVAGPLSVEVEPHWLNVPNAFTFLRVTLVPLVLWLLTLDGDTARWWALGVFVFAAWTDTVDGWVARRYGRITKWGKLADPIADKLLVLGTLASLAIVDEVPWWAVLVIAARELAVTLMRISLVRRRSLVIAASVWGKIKTVTQIVAISAILAPVVSDRVGTVLLWVAVVATVASGLVYANDIRRSSEGSVPAGR